MKHLSPFLPLIAFAFVQCEKSPLPMAESLVAGSISVTPQDTTLVALGSTVQLTAEALDERGGVMSNKSFAWSSSNERIAMVSSTGLVTALSAGSATVTVHADEVSASAQIRVSQITERVTVTPASPVLANTGDRIQLSASALDGNGNTIPNVSFVWSSSDESIATVSASGAVTGWAAGSVTITVTANGHAATVQIDVICLPNLPAPSLRLKGTEQSQVAGRLFTRYRLTVDNRSSFPDGLFRNAPDLPPCGLNQNAARTWVDIFDNDGRRIYGFCALGQAEALNLIWFSVAEGTDPPRAVYITLTDRQCGHTYISNTIEISS